MLRTTFGVPPGSDAYLQSLRLRSYTFAQMKALTGMSDGQMVWVSNYPANKGSLWRYSSALSEWFPNAPCKVYENTALITGLAQTADQLLVAIPVEAGLLAGKVWRLLVSLGKDGTTDAIGTATVLRMGTAGTTADTLVASTNLSGVLVASSRSVGLDFWNRMASATSVEKLGGAPQGAWVSNSASSAVLGNATTVANVTTQTTYVSITTTMGGTTNKPQLGYVALEIQP